MFKLEIIYINKDIRLGSYTDYYCLNNDFISFKSSYQENLERLGLSDIYQIKVDNKIIYEYHNPFSLGDKYNL